MRDEAWKRFVAHARRARAKPTFDSEERDWKLESARRIRAALEAMPESDDWFTPALEQPLFSDHNAFYLSLPQERNWLRFWAAFDNASLKQALGAFLERELDPEQRFARFADAALAAEAAGTMDPLPNAALTLGALFNFAFEPRALPLVRAPLFQRLETIFGEDTLAGAAPAERYSHHLSFARRVKERLKRDGFPVRDMLDVHSLIFIAALERKLWDGDRPRPAGRRQEPGREPATYLAVCALYRNEAEYLREWIEFHRLVGVERFFLYDNDSDDRHAEVLAPYLGDGTVVLHHWPEFPPVQKHAYEHCIATHRDDARWIAFIDIDEFLFSPARRPVSELLREYEDAPGVGVNWALFGPSGHRTKPAGLVTESYLRRLIGGSGFIKSIVDPGRVRRCANAHYFIYEQGLAVDENHHPIHSMGTKTVSFAKLRINHYFTKSEQEVQAKIAGRGERWDHLRGSRGLALEGGFEEERDDTITVYLDDLRGAIARTEGVTAGTGPA